MCGEQWVLGECDFSRQGSPPRVRGTVGQPFQGFRRHGITPACAGNSPVPFPTRPTSGDHPRVCGEQVLFINCAVNSLGSPPRVRGTVHKGRL